MRVHIRHARGETRNCSRGIRVFCKKHNLSYSELVFKGIEAEELRKLNDPQADKAIELAEKEAMNGW